MASIAVRYNEFAEINTEVLAINVDSVYSHKVWHDLELRPMAGVKIPFPILADETGNIGRAFDVYEQNSGKTLRGTFIIDHQGYIHGMELLTNPIGRCTGEILRQLKAFQQYVASGEMVPCDWKSGEQTIPQDFASYGNMSAQWQPQPRV